MTLTESSNNGRTQLHLSGELTISYVRAIKEPLLKYVRDYAYLTVDLSAVDEIDTAGLQMLMCCKKEAMKKSHTVLFNAHSQAVIEIADLLHMGIFFDLGEQSA